jgi:hypothetical protein
MKKVTAFLILAAFLFNLLIPDAQASMLAEYLCEIGTKFYAQGRYQEALHEFKKALMVEPNYAPALKYIRLLEKEKQPAQAEKETLLPKAKAFVTKSEKVFTDEQINQIAARIIKQKEAYLKRQAAEKITTPLAIAQTGRLIGKKPAALKALGPSIIYLDQLPELPAQPIEIEQGEALIIHAQAIQRFLLTEAGQLTVEKKSPDELLLTGKEIGYTYMYIWDAQGRQVLSFLTVQKQPEGETLAEQARKIQEKAQNFKFDYSLDWSSYEEGRRINDLSRTDYSLIQRLNFFGPTPYGDFDAQATINRFKKEIDLSYATIGLSNASFGDWKGFNLRGLDFFETPPDFSNLIFPGVSLRGALLSSPAFQEKLRYTAFYGRENWSSYGNLAPPLTRVRREYLNGLNLAYAPDARQNYQFTFTHGWGPDRLQELNPYGYDGRATFDFAPWKIDYELAYDSENFANLFTLRFLKSKIEASAELRGINKDFNSITGSGWRQGELGSLLSLAVSPTENWQMSATCDVYQDRLYPAPKNPQRTNQDVNWRTSYKLDPLTTLGLTYNLQNELGKISPYRYQSAETSFSRTLKLLNDIDLFAAYAHQENKNFTAPSLDYVNDRLYAGLRFRLFGEFYYYANKEVNWLVEKDTGNRSRPNAFETGLDWRGQIGKGPFSLVSRLTYRDEEDTESPLSFLSGEDYLEGYSEISYHSPRDLEIFGACRLRNIWSDNPNVTKRFEASFNLGLRYLWDTGLKWEPIGDIEGYVFDDKNFDGRMQKGETGLEGVRLWIDKASAQTTDMRGHYLFKAVHGRKAYVNIDSASIPSGFVFTTPAAQEATIAQHRRVRLDFGLTARSEISGFVFEDVDGDGEYNSKKDKGVRGVVFNLEEGSSATSDEQGRYVFTRIAPGEHTLELDLTSLPVRYLPSVAVTKKITLFQGVTYLYNIPLKVNENTN